MKVECWPVRTPREADSAFFWFIFLLTTIRVVLLQRIKKKKKQKQKLTVRSCAFVSGRKLDKVRMIGAQETRADERRTCSLKWGAASLSTVRPFCRLVIHLDNIPAMKRSTHSAGACASHDTDGFFFFLKSATNHMNKLQWKVLIGELTVTELCHSVRARARAPARHWPLRRRNFSLHPAVLFDLNIWFRRVSQCGETCS